jgi:hypothetical protein
MASRLNTASSSFLYLASESTRGAAMPSSMASEGYSDMGGGGGVGSEMKTHQLHYAFWALLAVHLGVPVPKRPGGCT